MWKIDVSSKVKIFLWRFPKLSLSTGDLRHQRNMEVTPACSICGLADSWRHSLFECNLARCVWALSAEDIVEHISLSAETVARQWLFFMMESMKGADFTRMIVTMWAI
jgi:hypothetical protein